jgi:hypothetical protein
MEESRAKFMGVQKLDLGDSEEELQPSQLVVNGTQTPISSSKHIIEEFIKKANAVISLINNSNGDKFVLTKSIEILHSLVQTADSYSLIAHLRILLVTNEFKTIDDALSHPILAPIITYLAIKIENVSFYLDWNIVVMRQKRLFRKPVYSYNINWFYTSNNPYIDNQEETTTDGI